MKTAGKLPRVRSELKVSGLGLVLNEDYRCTGSPRFRGDDVDSSDDSLRIEGVMFALAQTLLDVDDQ